MFLKNNMFFITKLVVIVLLDEAYAYTQDTEIILLPESNPIGIKEIPITLKVFGQLIQLNLRRHDQNESFAFQVWKYSMKSITEELLESNVSSHCQYYHEDHISSAVINFCHEHGLEGLIFLENDTIEIRPLRNKFTTLCFIDDFAGQTNLSFGKPHLIKKSLQYFADSNLYQWNKFKLKRRHIRNVQQNLTIELAVFLDEAAYNLSRLLVKKKDIKLHDMILTYVNRIQTILNLNLDVFINITLIRFDILKKQPPSLPLVSHYNNVHYLLDSFCKYANSLNFPDDSDPRHWDISLYLSGENLYEENSTHYLGIYNILREEEWHHAIKKDYSSTGKAYHDGACNLSLSCAVLEFRDYSDITSPVDAVYKISNLLGLTQNSSSSNNSEIYITWSKDSYDKIKKLWENKTCLRDQENIDVTHEKLNIKLAVFFDKAAYHLYMPILDNDKEKLRKMILAYVNQIQAMFHHPSFGASADISLVRLEIMETQPSNLSAVGEDVALLSSFCKYVNFLNPQDENNLHHWNIALYLTGIDLYQMKNEQKDYSSVGKSYVNSICDDNMLSCAIIEFGTTSQNAFSFSGFPTSRTAANEIGRMLGMHYDSDYINSTCSKGIYIMADFLYRRGQITWSECSRNVITEIVLWKTKLCLSNHSGWENLEDKLDHSHYHGLPGREWTAKAQCQLFLRDKDANVVTLHDICQVLQCETPHKDECFFAGPALDGTYCAHEKECRGGECVPVIEPPYIFPYCAQDNWSQWKNESCKSSCLTNSKGVRIKRRFCEHETNKTASCSGPYYDVDLCDDSSFCTEKRKSIYEYTDIKCNALHSKMTNKQKYFNKELFQLVDKDGRPGWQKPHDVEKPWIACIIHCRKNITYEIFQHYAPLVEMLQFDIDPYFPDGTWCHNENGQDYYCRQHYCLPENYSNEE